MIEVSGLGKRYWIGTRQDATVYRRLLSATGIGGQRPLWALKGLDLTVSPGESIGVIGPNGAGKSTLLLVLSGLLSPTEGRVSVTGRVSPFFQIGLGLYTELRVRDNLRLSCALFGMDADAARQSFDAIVEFGGLSEYLDARLGELSSGYQARVIFSAALHSEADVYLIDEVFAVGDAAFTGKCLQRLASMRARGATMVIASHSLEMIREACDRAVLLSAGKAAKIGPAADVVNQYLLGAGHQR